MSCVETDYYSDVHKHYKSQIESLKESIDYYNKNTAELREQNTELLKKMALGIKTEIPRLNSSGSLGSLKLLAGRYFGSSLDLNDILGVTSKIENMLKDE